MLRTIMTQNIWFSLFSSLSRVCVGFMRGHFVRGEREKNRISTLGRQDSFVKPRIFNFYNISCEQFLLMLGKHSGHSAIPDRTEPKKNI